MISKEKLNIGVSSRTLIVNIKTLHRRKLNIII